MDGLIGAVNTIREGGGAPADEGVAVFGEAVDGERLRRFVGIVRYRFHLAGTAVRVERDGCGRAFLAVKQDVDIGGRVIAVGGADDLFVGTLDNLFLDRDELLVDFGQLNAFGKRISADPAECAGLFTGFFTGFFTGLFTGFFTGFFTGLFAGLFAGFFGRDVFVKGKNECDGLFPETGDRYEVCALLEVHFLFDEPVAVLVLFGFERLALCARRLVQKLDANRAFRREHNVNSALHGQAELVFFAGDLCLDLLADADFIVDVSGLFRFVLCGLLSGLFRRFLRGLLCGFFHGFLCGLLRGLFRRFLCGFFRSGRGFFRRFFFRRKDDRFLAVVFRRGIVVRKHGRRAQRQQKSNRE